MLPVFDLFTTINMDLSDFNDMYCCGSLFDKWRGKTGLSITEISPPGSQEVLGSTQKKKNRNIYIYLFYRIS